MLSANPLEMYKEIDPELVSQFKNVQNLALSDGKLPAKFKFLIAMAMDIDHGTVEGATHLAHGAIKAGATKAEVVEALRVAYYIGGTGALFTAAGVLRNLK